MTAARSAVCWHLEYGGSRAATAEETHALRDQVLTKADYLVGIGHAASRAACFW